MKNFERISITSEKLLKNEELIILRGGENPCGEGFETIDCHFKFIEEDWDHDGLCCIPVWADPFSYIEEKFGMTIDPFHWNYCSNNS